MLKLFLKSAEICLMQPIRLFLQVFSVGLISVLYAGPEVYDPLSPFKKANSLQVRPSSETVLSGAATQTAEFTYEGGVLIKADYVGPKKAYYGATVYEYDKGQLIHERLLDPNGAIVEDIRYIYVKGRLDKTAIEDIKAGVQIEWHYFYDKEGKLIAGKRYNGKKLTESFKMVTVNDKTAQHIYSEKGELTAKVETVYEEGLLKLRIKTGLTGAKYAEYRYDEQKRLIEIQFHETVRGTKTLVKKHQFDYSLQKASSYTLNK